MQEVKTQRQVEILWAVLVGAVLWAGPGLGADPVRTGGDGESAVRIENLLERMTLEEKLSQLTQRSGDDIDDADTPEARQKTEAFLATIRGAQMGSFLNVHGAERVNRLQRVAVEESRLGIPLIFGLDVIHGYKTIFPIPLAETCSWDPDLVTRAAAVAATEARAAGIHWTFAPMVDIARDPRWGRVAEGAGEDPYLGAVMAAARVRGFQGEDPAAADRLLACAKHFCAYGGAEAGRDYNTVDVSERTLREVYLPPFKAAVDAGVGTFMSAFNDLNGIPATANPFILTEVLRQKWGFEGFVVSDWDSIGELVQHGIAASPADSARLAITAGVDMDMCSFVYRAHLAEEIRSGRISETVIDRAVRRVLKAKARLGLFEHPYVDPQREAQVCLTPEHLALAREVARSSIVLLKNHDDLLPLGKDLGTIAVLGPLADNRKDPFGTWAGIGGWGEAVDVLAGVRSAVSKETRVLHAKGCELEGNDRSGFVEALTVAKQADAVVLVVGEGQAMSGEAHCRTSLGLPGVQRDLVETVHAIGVPVVVVLMNGRPLSIGWTAEHVPAILETWHLGNECGHAVADVLFGDFNPSGKLPITFPRNVGQVPIYYYHKNTGRPPADNDGFTSKYLDTPTTPLFPFGYGLSYTTFGYADLEVSARKIPPGGEVTISAVVANKGKRPGHEIVQLYVRDVVASVSPPVKRLRGFRRIFLAPGETKRVSFTLACADLGLYNAEMKYVTEPGEFRVWIGPSSAEGLEGRFEVTK
ncbi:MAG: glycosyl hydrolase [bacterium]|nr:glycosyl hydrolase [bacterium]